MTSSTGRGSLRNGFRTGEAGMPPRGELRGRRPPGHRLSGVLLEENASPLRSACASPQSHCRAWKPDDVSLIRGTGRLTPQAFDAASSDAGVCHPAIPMSLSNPTAWQVPMLRPLVPRLERRWQLRPHQRLNQTIDATRNWPVRVVASCRRSSVLSPAALGSWKRSPNRLPKRSGRQVFTRSRSSGAQRPSTRLAASPGTGPLAPSRGSILHGWRGEPPGRTSSRGAPSWRSPLRPARMARSPSQRATTACRA